MGLSKGETAKLPERQDRTISEAAPWFHLKLFAFVAMSGEAAP